MTIKRMTFLQELLAFMGLEGRLHLDWISSAEAHKFVQVVTSFTNKIQLLGPSPLSGDFDMSAVVSLSEASQETLAAEGG
ncbi:MAG: hydrogenase iron-sulfur subunit [Deltaproteobacteria bacterium]|nr:hydrogenase iron-sulfur subunit [Deltaproteobacteria bacterium]